jgi:hypothetical protein
MCTRLAAHAPGAVESQLNVLADLKAGEDELALLVVDDALVDGARLGAVDQLTGSARRQRARGGEEKQREGLRGARTEGASMRMWECAPCTCWLL